MSIWKPALIAAVLAAAGCQPVGAPLGEKRLAEKIADALISEDDLGGIAMQQIQGMFQQGAIPQDRVSQVGIALSRELRGELPKLKETLVADLMKEFNIKELQFFHEQLTSEVARSVEQKSRAAMAGTGEQLQKLAQEAAVRAIDRVNSGWPTGAPPAAPASPPGLPPGMALPN